MAAAIPDTDLPPHARGDEGGRVILGVDDTPGGVAAARCAVALARARRAQLVAVRAWGLGLPRHGGWRHHHSGRGHLAVGYTGTVPRTLAGELVRRALRSAAGGIPGDLDVAIETPEGNPGPVLTAIACPGDVLVVGTARRHILKRVVHGSVSAYCTAHSRCPVAVVAAGRQRWYFPRQGGPAPAGDPASRSQP
jgi:nucleotide-binding universal stress UspA family protein